MTRDQIRNYLGWHNITYRQVADALGVSRSTVKGWFSTRCIPARRMQELTAYIKEDMHRRGGPDGVKVEVELNQSQYRRLCEEAERYGETEQEYIKKIIQIRLGL